MTTTPTPVTDVDPYELDLDEVTRLVLAAGVDCTVEQTGGGCATIYAGPQHADPADVDHTRYAAVAGPGTYGWGAKPSTAHLLEFYIGPDDDGEQDPIDPAAVGAVTAADVARLIVAQATRERPDVTLSFDDVEALGFDGTGRSLPAPLAWEAKATEVYCAASNVSNRELAEAGVMDRRDRNEAAGNAAREAWVAANPKPTA